MVERMNTANTCLYLSLLLTANKVIFTHPNAHWPKTLQMKISQVSLNLWNRNICRWVKRKKGWEIHISAFSVGKTCFPRRCTSWKLSWADFFRVCLIETRWQWEQGSRSPMETVSWSPGSFPPPAELGTWRRSRCHPHSSFGSQVTQPVHSRGRHLLPLLLWPGEVPATFIEAAGLRIPMSSPRLLVSRSLSGHRYSGRTQSSICSWGWGVSVRHGAHDGVSGVVTSSPLAPGGSSSYGFSLPIRPFPCSVSTTFPCLNSLR